MQFRRVLRYVWLVVECRETVRSRVRQGGRKTGEVTTPFLKEKKCYCEDTDCESNKGNCDLHPSVCARDGIVPRIATQHDGSDRLRRRGGPRGVSGGLACVEKENEVVGHTRC